MLHYRNLTLYLNWIKQEHLDIAKLCSCNTDYIQNVLTKSIKNKSQLTENETSLPLWKLDFPTTPHSPSPDTYLLVSCFFNCIIPITNATPTLCRCHLCIFYEFLQAQGKISCNQFYCIKWWQPEYYLHLKGRNKPNQDKTTPSPLQERGSLNRLLRLGFYPGAEGGVHMWSAPISPQLSLQ